jgi:hypothetical protein
LLDRDEEKEFEVEDERPCVVLIMGEVQLILQVPLSLLQ